jgi:outer membrane protein OmpA-like peptidoglycan-associated protein
MKYRNAFILIGLCLALVVPAKTQFKTSGLGGGIGGGDIFGDTDLRDRVARYQARVFLRYGLIDHIQGEVGAGLGRIAGARYEAVLIPIDYRFVFSPFSFDKWNPYLYGGGGVLHYKSSLLPQFTTTNEISEWTGFIPAGGGIQLKLGDLISFEISGGYNFTFSDNINGVQIDDQKDNYWSFLIGLSTSGGESDDADPDKDGLSNKEEKQLGTDPHNADTDGDGLTDGEEVHQYHTNPLKADSDGDGLSDGDEVNKYKTNPNKADTDGDGLNDKDEIFTYHTDPLKTDTDGDGLSDGDEALKYNTDPLKADTDGDNLSDGDEVQKYHTDPLKKDTDGGSVNDGDEIAHSTDPLNPNDDVPQKKEELKAEVGKAIILDGIVFATNKTDITPQSEEILRKAFNTLEQNPDIEVEIHGYTDNVGKQPHNMKLSQGRADSVKAYLVKKGIAADRITTKGFGPDKPIAPNTTEEGRQKNRRIEFFRTK